MSNLQIVEFKPIRKGYLIAKMDVMINSVGMLIREVTAFNKEGHCWFNFPSRKFEDDEGKTCYYSYVRIPDAKYHAAFQRAMRAEFDRYIAEHPEVLDDSNEQHRSDAEHGGPAF